MFSQALVNLKGFNNIIYEAHLKAKGVPVTEVDGVEMQCDLTCEEGGLVESIEENAEGEDSFILE